MLDLWICPDPDCDGYAINSDILRVTCTRSVPHLEHREFPDMVPVARLKREAAIAPLAAEAVRLSGNRSCRDGESPMPHLNPQAFAKLAAAVGERPDDGLNPLGGAARGVGRCLCAAGPGTNPACPVHP